jgi:hypothetical protein
VGTAADADQHVHGTGGRERAEQGARVGAAGVAGLLGDVDRGLESDEGVVREDGAAQQRGGGALLGGAEGAEPSHVTVAAQQQPRAEGDDDEQAADLDDGGDHVGAGGLLDAPGVDQRQQGEEDHGDQSDGQGHEGGQVVAAEAPGQRGHRDDAGGEHAEARDEPGERPEGAGGVVGGAARAGVLRGQLGVGGRGQQGEQQRNGQRRPHRSPGVGGHLADQDVDTGAEDVAEDEEVEQRSGQGALERRALRGRRGRRVRDSCHAAPGIPGGGVHAW